MFIITDRNGRDLSYAVKKHMLKFDSMMVSHRLPKLGI